MRIEHGARGVKSSARRENPKNFARELRSNNFNGLARAEMRKLGANRCACRFLAPTPICRDILTISVGRDRPEGASPRSK